MDRNKIFSTISCKQGGFYVFFGETSNTEKVKGRQEGLTVTSGVQPGPGGLLAYPFSR